MFKPIKQNKAFLQIAKQIRDQIESGNLKKGDRLPPERSLAESFGTSRATVREALRALEVIGLIESRVGQGTFIRTSTLSDVDQQLSEIEKETSPLEVFEARFAIEPYLAKLASYNATKDDLDYMEHTILKMDELQNEYSQFEYWDGEFHKGIALASKNTLLIKFTDIINNVRLETLWGSMKKRSLTKERIQYYQESHKKIFHAIKERNGTLAEKALLEHLSNVRSNFFNEQ